MTMSAHIIRTTLEAELVTIRAQMQAIETTLKPGQCALLESDALYGRQEELKSQLWELEDAEYSNGNSNG
jgi:UDP-N-acetyl-D-mannosaminuronate dehydrogenase